MQRIKNKIKGSKGGECTRTDCTNNNSEWFHHSNRTYYCLPCARVLNSDPFNARDAESMYGHKLLTHESVEIEH